jgi:alkanesulfonate monooxygenase SsuD/methylene tetrahydromethanopterin reductase-like flavin-dependent oxidoreductase (luciferase family)
VKSGVLVDPAKVHGVNFQGKHYSTRGLLNSGPAPQGRKLEDCKVLFLVNPILGETMEDARERKRRRIARALSAILQRLAQLGNISNVDFGRFDLDKPLPDDVTATGNTTSLAQFRKMAAGRSIRETIVGMNGVDLSVELVGTPDAVADRMGEVMQEGGGDGFLFMIHNLSRRLLAEIEDGLVPAQQDRGLMRKAYEHAQFRDNLLAF